jgi:sec-independent protein translocase protein TatA
MPNIGPMEIVGLLLLALLLFGAKRLPEIGRSLGSGMREFKDSVSGEKKPEARSELPPPVPAATAPLPDAPVADDAEEVEAEPVSAEAVPAAPEPEAVSATAPASSSEREDEPPAAASA